MIQKLYPPKQLERYLFIDLFSLICLAYLTFAAPQPFGWGISLGLYVLTLLTFYIGIWQRGWMLVLASWAGLGIVTIYALFYNEWLLLYGFMYADLLGRARSVRHMAAGMAGIAVMFLVTHAALHGDLFTFFTSPFMPVMALQLLTPYIIQTIERSRLLSTKLNDANRKLERYIQEEERTRIARDLHDTLGQTLTMIKMKSELASRLVDKDSERARSEIEEIKTSSRQALQQVRELVTSMRHVSLEEELSQAQILLMSAGIALEIRSTGSVPPLPPAVETMLALSLREAVTNIVKHSRADRCSIARHHEEDHCRITITDNGCGISPDSGEGFGLPSMHERMRQVHGEAHVSSVLGQGTAVELIVPVMTEHS
ncbi:sensor histidine kinase [Paenibacillus lemnae]|uniref:Oxygen sensor histidine kinase NreB n=1 Tax=Paenibacillus lemnae TaxID=1330551 RepID=A0A848M4M4_PAELE|nr:sensor histidine kinase [Paenibacillus lemnae]NMO95062.1 sensor histidine kinase [Paenibacillus lemnae]